MRWIPLQRVGDLVQWLDRYIRNATRPCRRRDALGVLLGLHGLRSCEVVALQRGDFDQVNGTLEVRTAKGGRARQVPIGKGTVDALVAYLGTHGFPPLLATRTGRPLSTSVLRRRVARFTTAALGVRFSFHSLRHTYAMQLYERTRDILLVKKALGHRSISSTLVYAETLADLRQMLLFDLGSETDEDRSRSSRSIRETGTTGCGSARVWEKA